MAPQGPRLGLLLGLASFLLFLLAQLGIFFLAALYILFSVATWAVLSTSARGEPPRARTLALAGLVLGCASFLLFFATNALGNAAFSAADFAGWERGFWVRAVAEVGIVAGFFVCAQRFGASRSSTLLQVALGAAVAVSFLAAYSAQAPAAALAASYPGPAKAPPGSDAFGAWSDGALAAFNDATSNAELAKGVPYILLAWAYATILGRLRTEAQPKDPWASKPGG